MQTTFHIAVSVLVFVAVQGQFLHELHVKENTMKYKNIINLRQLLISKNKIAEGDQYEMYLHKGDGMFMMDHFKNLKVNKPIDREQLCPTAKLKQMRKLCSSVSTCCLLVEFTVMFNRTDGRFSEPQTHYIRIFVDDINDNTPVFPPLPPPYIVVDENQRIGYKILLPKAQDPDNVTNSVALYRVIRPFIIGNHSDFEPGFDAKSGAPVLVVVNNLDRERCRLYRFRLEAIDGIVGHHRNTGTVEVSIHIRDVNDNAPQFNRHTYIKSIPENSPNDKLFDVVVTDADEKENAELELNLEFEDNKDYGSIFMLESINKHAGGRVEAVLRTRRNLDYEQAPTNLFQFRIVAQDQGRMRLSTTASVRIQLTNMNDEPPRITFIRKGRPYASTFTIQEEVPLNFPLAHLQVSDSDSIANQLHCSLASHNNLFMLKDTHYKHPINLYKKYTLRTAAKIDREALVSPNVNSMLHVTVRCCDQDNQHPLCTNSTVNVHISDINDNPPLFTHSRYYGFVDENRANTLINFNPNIEAKDKDISSQNNIKYRLKNLNGSLENVAELFKIHRDSNSIYTIDGLDYEHRRNYTFLIVALDQGHPTPLSSSATIIVKVRDTNDHAPEFTKPHYKFSVLENSPVGHLIGRVHATDADNYPGNKRVHYRMKLNGGGSSMNEGARLIKLDKNTGDIRVNQNIDREQIQTITVTIEAVNSFPLQLPSNTQEVMVLIEVGNVNDMKPYFELTGKPQLVLYRDYGNSRNVCEPIPYKARDGDKASPDSAPNDCCLVTLKDDYKGALSLYANEEMVCVHMAAIKVDHFKVSLVAYDTRDNNSLTAEVTFPIFIRQNSRYQNNNFPKRGPYNQHNTGIYGNGKNGNRGSENGSGNSMYQDDDVVYDIRQIVLIVALASLVGLVVVAIIMVILFGQKKCDIFHMSSYGSTYMDETEKLGTRNHKNTIPNNIYSSSHNNNAETDNATELSVSESILFLDNRPPNLKSTNPRNKKEEDQFKIGQFSTNNLKIYNSLNNPPQNISNASSSSSYQPLNHHQYPSQTLDHYPNYIMTLQSYPLVKDNQITASPTIEQTQYQYLTSPNIQQKEVNTDGTMLQIDPRNQNNTTDIKSNKNNQTSFV